jgi:hypothetical protein
MWPGDVKWPEELGELYSVAQGLCSWMCVFLRMWAKVGFIQAIGDKLDEEIFLVTSKSHLYGL